METKQKRGSTIRRCEQCGKEFSVWNSAIAKGRGRCCSAACAAKNRTGKKILTPRKTRNDKKPRKSYTCKWCSKEFVEDRPRSNVLYCSNKCSATARGLARRSGKSDGRRTLEFRVWSREIVKRDMQCLDCGEKEGLQAHHIEGWNDAPELRYDLSNGETLCWRCHHTRHPELPIELFERKSKRRVIPCEHCGKSFVARKLTLKYCSQACAIEATATRPINIVQCETCGETIITRDPNRRFCCVACKRVDDSKRMLGPVGERMRAKNPMHILHRKKQLIKNEEYGDE